MKFFLDTANLDELKKAAAWGVVDAPASSAGAGAWLDESITASVAANELSRAMGMRDLYPFTLTPGVRAKVEFCWGLTGPARHKR